MNFIGIPGNEQGIRQTPRPVVASIMKICFKRAMNLYAWIILSALLVEYFLNLAADLLTLKTLNPNLPEEFQGFYDEVTYRKSQEYTRASTRFGILTSTIQLAATLLFWFCGGFNALDVWVRSFGFGPVITGLIYIGILLLLVGALSLPFHIYQTFAIEERFGFNKTTPRTFILDLIKIIGLSIALGGPLLGGILAFFQYAGPNAWIACWAVSAGFILLVQFIAPTWIMPLFNKFQPLEEGELKSRLMAYAQSVRFPLEGIYVMDGSRRSTKSNAFFTGFGNHKRIALFDTILKNHTPEEILAILAHEIGHYKKRHMQFGLVVSIAHMGVIFYLLSIFLTHKGLFDAFHMRHMSIYAGLIFFGMLYSPVELILSLFLNALSRRHEYQADRFAAESTGLADTMITALKRLSAHNLSNLTPHPLDTLLRASHPLVLKRIKALRQIAASKPRRKAQSPPPLPGEMSRETQPIT